jgi:hypothetical protein
MMKLPCSPAESLPIMVAGADAHHHASVVGDGGGDAPKTTARKIAKWYESSSLRPGHHEKTNGTYADSVKVCFVHLRLQHLSC